MRRDPRDAPVDRRRRPGSGRRSAAARTRSATASAAPGPAERRGPRPTSRAWRGRIVEQRRGVEQRVGVERLVLDEPGRAGLDEARRVRPLVAGGVRIRHDDHRQAERGHLGQRRGAGPADDQVRGGERRQHLVAQERVRPVARADGLGQRLAAGQRRRVAVVAGHVDDRDPLDEPGSASATAALNRRTACEPPKTRRTRSPAGDVQPLAGRLAVDRRRCRGSACR